MTEHGEELELSAQEREGYARLPSERVPGDLLEERVVRGLRRRGLLRDAGSGTRGITRAWLGAAAAAGLVLFLSGLGLGQWLGSRSATEAFLAVRAQDATMAAARVQETGTAYVAALATLLEVRGEGASEQRSQGSQAAMGALLAATDMLSRLNPDDPAVIRLRQALEDSGVGGPLRAVGAPAERIIWF